jgi:hypothetical protein
LDDMGQTFPYLKHYYSAPTAQPMPAQGNALGVQRKKSQAL